MLKKFVFFSQNGLSKKKLALVAGTVIAIILCLVAYIAILEPIVSRFLLTTTSIHEGMDHYKNQTYLEFESGDRFHEVLNTMDSLKHGTVVDFYHVDNHLRDNLFYGKMCDVFAVDVSLDQQNYSDEKAKIATSESFCCNLDDFALYLSDYQTGAEGEVVLIATCDEVHIVRYILLTDMDPMQFTSYYGRTLIQQSSLNWDICTTSEQFSQDK